jgi:hypothetical protein
MRTSGSPTFGKIALITHLLQFPEDLRDIRRLVARFELSLRDVAEGLEAFSRISAAGGESLT